jgi:putative nucleotidyltransferase with HDIG domain
MASNSYTPNPGSPPPFVDDQKIAAEILLRRLPTLPTVSARLLGMMGQEEINLKEISNLITSDATLTGEILRLSNSAMVGARSEVRSILQALAILGLEKVKGLACTIALRSYLGNALQIPALKRCWRHNLATAVVAAELADWARQDGGEAYTAGILHDIGRIALIAIEPAHYLQVIETTIHGGGTLCEHEKATYGLSHASAGEWLASTWNLPASICKAIRNHHHRLESPYFEVDGLVHHACRIADAIGFSALPPPPPSPQPVLDFLAGLPAVQRERLHLDIAEWQILVAARINALES